MPRATISLATAVGALRTHYGPPPPLPTADPFELVLLENAAYLTTPARKRAAFEELRATVGTRPDAILEASRQTLERATQKGILKSTFAIKLRACARIAVEEFGGDLDRALEGPIASARHALRRFPGIGEPGAEKILLFTGRHPFLAPESNGLRVLTRLGLVREETSYAKTYAGSRLAAKALPADVRVHQEAHLLLKLHGETLCRRSAPHCAECPLAAACAHARREVAGTGSNDAG